MSGNKAGGMERHMSWMCPSFHVIQVTYLLSGYLCVGGHGLSELSSIILLTAF
jgi:hypothetical protein